MNWLTGCVLSRPKTNKAPMDGMAAREASQFPLRYGAEAGADEHNASGQQHCRHGRQGQADQGEQPEQREDVLGPRPWAMRGSI
jgi:hypothetical protein